jgi:hypothetical protein
MKAVSQTNRVPRILFKLFFALLSLSALITEIVVSLERGIFNPANFFSYFTVQVNIIVVVTLLISAFMTAANRSPKWLDVLRSATTVYILVVGIGFAILLSGLEGIVLTAAPWDNTVLHYITPLAVLLDFIFDRPRAKLQFKKSLAWITFPILYVVYSLTRGAITGWYPYPFLNPVNGGYGKVAITVGGLIVLGTILIWLVTKVRLRK